MELNRNTKEIQYKNLIFDKGSTFYQCLEHKLINNWCPSYGSIK